MAAQTGRGFRVRKSPNSRGKLIENGERTGYWLGGGIGRVNTRAWVATVGH